jgi:hypothetical protein
MRERLRAGLSPNGKLVHLANVHGHPVCGSGVTATCFVRARITCKTCRARRSEKARRLDGRPFVVGVDWSPLYAAFKRALDGGAAEEPKVKVRFWPVLA